MHIHTVLVSYKRMALTKIALQAYLDTVSVPHSIIIVDNGSPQETVDWLNTLDVPVALLWKNYFPGFATNLGWGRMPPETTLLHRLDNDTKLLPGWCENALKCFEDPLVGQYGLIAAGDAEWMTQKNLYPSGWQGWTCGGNSIISRKIYDQGLRYSERPWTSGGYLEDTQLTVDVWNRRYKRVFATQPVMEYMSIDDPEYDSEIKRSRGIL